MTNPPIPPAVVEAMARAIGSHPMHEDDRGPDNEVLHDMLPAASADLLVYAIAQTALSAALASGEIMATNKHEEALGKVIDEREEIAEAFSQAYFLVVGVSPPFSSAWGLSHALEEIEEACALLRVAATGSVVICSPELKEVVDAALIGLERFDKHAMSAEFSHEMFDTLRKHREFMLGITRLAQARAQAAATQ